jgi:hypothetical protein
VPPPVNIFGSKGRSTEALAESKHDARSNRGYPGHRFDIRDPMPMTLTRLPRCPRSWNVTLEYPTSGSLALDVCGLDDRPPLLNFGLLESTERLRSLLFARRDALSNVGKPLAHRRVSERFYRGAVEA